MQLDIYTALKSVKISDANARAVVEAMEIFMASKVEEATKPLRDDIDRLDKKIESYNANNRWVFGIIGFVVAAAAIAGPIITAYK
jgi:hypothetical protein